MPKFRRRPAEIEAEQFLPDSLPLPFERQGAVAWDGWIWFVTTAHGQKTRVVDGDWIIPEPNGHGFYPCKSDIFEAMYEPVD